MQNDVTPNFNLPLPFAGNTLAEDVQRLRDALTAIDSALSAAATDADIAAAIDTLVNGAPVALDQLNELAAALGNDPNFSSTILTALNGKLSSEPATATRLGGVKIGGGLNVALDGTVSAVVAEGGTGLPAYDEIVMTPTSNGQTLFSVSGGYIVGQMEIYFNGSQLIGNGDDYTAANGSTFTLTVGANTVDKLLIRRWKYLPAANALNKTGDTMGGALYLAGDPGQAMQAATKQYVDALKAYVDNLLAGLKPKNSVKVATTANITLSGLQAIDGYTTVAGDRVLVRSQSAAAQNGIYVAAAGAWTRATDADTWLKLVSASVMVEQGTTLADTGWVCTVDQGGTLGTTSVAFVKFAGGFVTAADVPALAVLPIELVSTNAVAVMGKHYVFITGGVTLTLPTSFNKDEVIKITNSSGANTPAVDFGTTKLRQQSPGLMFVDIPWFQLQYSGNPTYGLV